MTPHPLDSLSNPSLWDLFPSHVALALERKHEDPFPLNSFDTAVEALDSFFWAETPEGYKYWNSLYEAAVCYRKFAEAAVAHDLTYAYSDDPRSYRAGKVSEAKLQDLARSLDKDVVATLYNRIVDYRISPHVASRFYW